MPELPRGTVTFLFTNIEGGGAEGASWGPVPGRFGREAGSGGGLTPGPVEQEILPGLRNGT